MTQVILSEEQFNRLANQRDHQHRELIAQLEKDRDSLVKALLPAGEMRDSLIELRAVVDGYARLANTLRDEDLRKIATASERAGRAHDRVEVLEKNFGRIILGGGALNLALVIGVLTLVWRVSTQGG